MHSRVTGDHIRTSVVVYLYRNYTKKEFGIPSHLHEEKKCLANDYVPIQVMQAMRK